MSQEKPVLKRFIGLDLHKHYLVVIGLDEQLNHRKSSIGQPEIWKLTTCFGQESPRQLIIRSNWLCLSFGSKRKRRQKG